MDKHVSNRLSDNDEEIVNMYWERNPNAIEATNLRYGYMLRNVAYNILRDDQDCEECQNDTYLKIWNVIPSARPVRFAAFIMQIMRRIALMRYREKSRKKQIPSHFTVSLDELEEMSSGISVEEEYDAKELGRLITDYVKKLNVRQQHIFVDRYYLAEPVEKTANELSVSVGTVYNEIKKIKQGLKEYLEKNGVHI